MHRYGGFNAPPPPTDVDDNDSDDGREEGRDSLSDESQSNPVAVSEQPQNLPSIGPSVMALKLLRDNAEDSAGGARPQAGSESGIGRKLNAVASKSKVVRFGSFERLADLNDRQPSFLKNEDSLEIDMPGELPKFNSRPAAHRQQNISQSLVMCMDPTCTSCPPEFHALRRRQRSDTARLPERNSEASRTLKADLAGLSDSDSDDSSDFGIFKKRLGKVFSPRRNLRRLHDAWLTFCGLFRLDGVLNPNSTFVKGWNQFFVNAMFIAFAVDPLFFFVIAVSAQAYCIYIDWSYLYILSAVRTSTDFIYFLHTLMQFRLAYKEPAAPTKRFYWWGKRQSVHNAGEWVFDRHQIMWNYIYGWFLFDIFALLPIPQVMALAVIPDVAGGPASSGANLLRACVLLQYIPRIRRCYLLISGSQATGLLFESAWASFVLNLIMYIMSSHVLGALWYLAALQRWDRCAYFSCGRQLASGVCKYEYLNCPDGIDTTTPAFAAGQGAWVANGTIIQDCMWKFNQQPESFDYGLFAPAIPLAFETTAFDKYIYALQWGFTQISTLGGNQIPSQYVPEVLLMISITAAGLLLFAVLIGNIQTFLQSLTRRTLEYQLHRRDVENWMTRRNLPRSLATRVRDLERLQWAANQGVDEQEVLGTLTEDLQREVRRHLCLDLIKKSKLFSAMENAILDFICERLVQRIYINGTVISREGFPVKRMFFILKGELESTTTGGGRTGFFNRVMLGNGDFFGEELLIAYLERTEETMKSTRRSRRSIRRGESSRYGLSSGGSSGSLLDVFPPSERTIICAGPVEGFTLEAEDLEFMCRQFGDILHRPGVQNALNQCSQNRRVQAAVTIQLRFRAHLRKRLNVSVAHFHLAQKERRLGGLMKWAINNPGKQPMEVHLNPIIYPGHRAPGLLLDAGPKNT